MVRGHTYHHTSVYNAYPQLNQASFPRYNAIWETVSTAVGGQYPMAHVPHQNTAQGAQEVAGKYSDLSASESRRRLN